MAPRRGGGSSGGSSIYVYNQCVVYDAFESGYAQAQISLMGGFLFFFLILACCTCCRSGKRKTAGQERSILRWYQYGIALFLIIALFIMLIVRYSLIECGVLYEYGYDSTAIGTATDVIYNVNDLFMLGIVLFVVIRRLFQLAGSTNLKRTMVILGAILFTIVAIIFVAWIVIYCLSIWDVGSVYTRSTQLAYLRLRQAYVVLFLVLSVFAVVGLILAWIRLARKPERKQGVTNWIPVLIICLLGYSLYKCIILFILYYGNNVSGVTLLIGYGLSLLWFFGSFLSIFMIARGKGWDFLRLPQDIQPQPTYNFVPPPQMPPYNQNAYDAMQSPDAYKRTSSASHGNTGTPAPPYMGTGMTYSGNGVYEPQGQTYGSGGWGAGGYAPVVQMPTAYSAPMGAASRDAEHNELTGRR